MAAEFRERGAGGVGKPADLVGALSSGCILHARVAVHASGTDPTDRVCHVVRRQPAREHDRPGRALHQPPAHLPVVRAAGGAALVLSDLYSRQAALVVRLLPLVAEESCFALKSGTAINFFVRDMPRLSVDIDLMDLPVKNRRSSLAEIESALTHWRLSTKKPATIELSLGGHRADKDGWIAAGRELRGRVPGEASRAYGHAGDGRRWNGRKDTLSIGRGNRVGVPKPDERIQLPRGCS